MWQQSTHRARIICTVSWRSRFLFVAEKRVPSLCRHLHEGPQVTASSTRIRLANFLTVALPVTGIGVLTYGFMFPDKEPLFPVQPTEAAPAAEEAPAAPDVVANWSGTHTVCPRHHYMPETEEEVDRLVAAAHESCTPLRIAGQCLSPNGLALSDGSMLSMGLLDKVLHVDVEKQQVTVQAGCKVQQVADYLRPYGLTLQNYASIREQQIGGFTQVGAHGTGATIPPVDEQVVSMRLVTPGKGVLELSESSDPATFRMARVGLGALGVATRFTLQCVKAHKLVEETFTTDSHTIKTNHAKWMKHYQHLRYMWIPYTDTVVVVRSNPAASTADESKAQLPGSHSQDQRLQPLRDLLTTKTGAQSADIADLSATQLRDALLAAGGCLDTDWVRRVNRAEAEFWKMSGGWRVGYSDEILGFDCGGQQWVLETAFPVGSLRSLGRGWWPKYPDLDYMEDLLSEIDRGDIAAPAPLEQRWTSASLSPMSPASALPGSSQPADAVHSWVGVIMYLPTDEEATRDAITGGFRHYSQMVEQRLMPKYAATWHWAKLEPPTDPAELLAVQQQLRKRFPVEQFNQLRAELDPHNVLANEWLKAVLPRN